MQPMQFTPRHQATVEHRDRLVAEAAVARLRLEARAEPPRPPRPARAGRRPRVRITAPWRVRPSMP